ncbi:hypothetical protein HKX48_009442 [Thoreauomyces humboldtii]|nr:hypothetical protein HKX48_009442 [Thoreauomyces humboldtii]
MDHLLGDDEGSDSPSVRPAAKKDQKVAPTAAKKDVARNDKKPAERAPRNEYPRRGGFAGGNTRGGAVEGGAPRAPRQNREPRETGDFEQKPSDVRADGERRTGAPRGGRGGARGGRGGGAFRGREFDRHSATGRHDGPKKEIAVAGSALTAEEEAKEDVVKDISAEKTEGEASATAEPAAPKEQDPEDNFKTLEQYIAEKARADPNTNVRKPNEGADNSQWKDAVVLKKVEDTELFAELLKPGKKGKSAASKDKTQKTFVNIDQRFEDSQNQNQGGRGGFSGRGGRGRGGESRGGRGGAQSDRAPRQSGGGRQAGGQVRIEDQNAFPSLGGK